MPDISVENVAYAALAGAVTGGTVKINGRLFRSVAKEIPFEQYSRLMAKQGFEVTEEGGEVVLTRVLTRQSKGGEIVGPLVDPVKLERILANLKKRNITVIRGDKAAQLLDDIGAGAAYNQMFGKPRLIFRDGTVTRGRLVEELMHHGQSLRRGFAEASDSIAARHISILDEIEAQKYILNLAKRKKIGHKQKLHSIKNS